MVENNLIDRIQEILKGTKGITSKKMFGGHCFLHNGNMLCGIDNKNKLIVRVGPDFYEKSLLKKHAREMDFTGKALKGMIYIDNEGIKSKKTLEGWINLGLSFTKSLPKK